MASRWREAFTPSTSSSRRATRHELIRFVKAYAKGETGSNLITLTCADLDTYTQAVKDPERYDLVRVRMGGWTEFYATMFPAHRQQHQRRQYFTPTQLPCGAE